MEQMKKWCPLAWALGLMCVTVSGCRKSEAPSSAIGVQLPSLTVATQTVMPVVEQVLTNLTSAMIDNTNTTQPSNKYIGSGLLAEEVRASKTTSLRTA
jgi:hypothetical protein